MSGITFDLGNAPSVLAALRNPGNAQLLANAMAESYTDDTLDWIQSGRSFTGRTGQLAQSIGWRPAGNGSAEVYANAEYAGFVENGTRPHVIRPRNGRALRFPIGGGAGFGFARVINHPGSRPHPFFFADSAARGEHMQAAGLSVLARIIANGQ
ncbi:MAG: HK97 gp10 family phage protein [Methylobacter sp.]|uniref:HK97 gp10 family phage protein n=1 Tax=Methylobacter sp. TaxID=2051955 RepID=UPI002731432D|nr:HK97 gp10 family phage protein [Methylobacter sp.]MDP1664132.1 HK97 gp10 family phage protein [Methylobacter sp.]